MTTDQTPDPTERLECGRAQLLEAMSAVSEDRTCCGWAADWARTLHAEGGIWETLGRAVGWPTGDYDAWVWVSWEEAAALYGHAVSSVGQAPATGQTALTERIAAKKAEPAFQAFAAALADTDQTVLRDRIAAALEREDAINAGYDHSFANRYGVDPETDGFVDAVLAALPTPTDRAAEARIRGLHQQYRFAGDDTTDYCAHCNQISGGWIPWPCPTIRALDGDEAAVPGRAGDETAHRCRNCEGVDPDTCLMNPDRPQSVTVHAIPLPGSNGISSCCGRPPCEFVGERLTRDPGKVTCPGPGVGGAQQPKEA
jgi:hypothetical protein